MLTSDTLVNSQRTSSEINKTGDTGKVRILVEQVMLSDVLSHLE